MRIVVAAALVSVVSIGCTRQVCECAVYVGGTTPASHEEERGRASAVDQCLAQHGGGTITGCPMPASVPPARESP